MQGRKEGRIDGYRRTHGQPIEGRMDRYRRTHGQIEGRTDRYKDARTDIKTHGQI